MRIWHKIYTQCTNPWLDDDSKLHFNCALWPCLPIGTLKDILHKPEDLALCHKKVFQMIIDYVCM